VQPVQSALTPAQLTGLDDSHLQTLADGHRLRPAVIDAFTALRQDAAMAGFELAIASSYRSFERQLAIWNGKARGLRELRDDAGALLRVDELTADQRLLAILRFSAIPGTSRHHWGTDIDVFDAAAVHAGYRVQLTPAEVADDGLFAPLHAWLDRQMAAGHSHGFFRPYREDRGGIAPERWHLSYAPLAVQCAANCSDAVFRAAWASAEDRGGLELREEIEAMWPSILSRYITVPAGWAASGRG